MFIHYSTMIILIALIVLSPEIYLIHTYICLCLVIIAWLLALLTFNQLQIDVITGIFFIKLCQSRVNYPKSWKRRRNWFLWQRNLKLAEAQVVNEAQMRLRQVRGRKARSQFPLLLLQSYRATTQLRSSRSPISEISFTSYTISIPGGRPCVSLIREKTRVKFVDCVCNNGNELPLLFTEEPSSRRKPRRRGI